METVAVKAQVREEMGSRGANLVRKDGLIPAVVYGGDTVHHIGVGYNELRHAIYTPDFKIVNLDINGESYRCIVRDVQFHPVTEDIVHVDFLMLVPGKPVRVEIPVHFAGTSPGIKAGGRLVKKMRKIAIRTKPENLIHEYVVDISGLLMGQSIRVKDAKTIDGIEVLSGPNQPLATVAVPRALKGADAIGEEEEEEEGTEAAAAEGASETPAEGGEE